MSARPTRQPRRVPAGTLLARAVCAAVLVLLAGAGCSQLDLRQSMPWSEPEPETPARMVDTWTDTVLWQPGKAGVRGFGGRIMFFQRDDEDPIVVDGTLTVYAFDDDDPDPDKPPAKKYIFLAEKLPGHYSESKVGHSYSFWLPWDDVGGPERQIGLITRFEDKEGKVVMSKVAHKILPGKKVTPGAEEPRNAGAISGLDYEASGTVRQVTHEEPMVASPKKSSARMKTTAIALSPSFAKRLAAASESQAESDPAVKPGNQAPEDDSSTSEEGQPPATAVSQAGRSAGSNDSRGELAADASRSARPERSRFPAQKATSDEQAYGPFRTRPRPARWPFPLPRTPRPERFRRASATTPAGESAAN